MTAEELIKLPSHKIRNNAGLMAFYLDVFKDVFGRKPNCAGCSFSGDFKKLKNFILKHKNQNLTTMAKQAKDAQYVLKKENNGKILRYKNKDGRIIRRYGRDITDDFAENFLASNFGKLTKKQKKDLFAVIGGKSTSKNKKDKTVGETSKDLETDDQNDNNAETGTNDDAETPEAEEKAPELPEDVAQAATQEAEKTPAKPKPAKPIKKQAGKAKKGKGKKGKK